MSNFCGYGDAIWLFSVLTAGRRSQWLRGLTQFVNSEHWTNAAPGRLYEESDLLKPASALIVVVALAPLYRLPRDAAGAGAPRVEGALLAIGSSRLTSW